jgi:Co/Zn/Cd efflux system component
MVASKCVRFHGSHGDHARLPIGASPEERRSSNLVVGVGLLADTAMTVAKAAIGAWSGSPALLSDAVHGASDMLVSIAVLATRCDPVGDIVSFQLDALISPYIPL